MRDSVKKAREFINEELLIIEKPSPYYMHVWLIFTGSTPNQRRQTTVPVGSSRILRLFGVNLECQPEESEPSTPDSSPLSNQGPTFQHSYNDGLHQPAYSSSDPRHDSPMVRRSIYIHFVFNIIS